MTDPNGNVSCTIPSLDQGSPSPSPRASPGTSTTHPRRCRPPATVTEPTVLTVNSATSAYSEQHHGVGCAHRRQHQRPDRQEPVASRSTVPRRARGAPMRRRSRPAAWSRPARLRARSHRARLAATYTLSGTFGGDTTLPLQLTSSSGTAPFVVTLEGTALTYTGGTTAQNGQSLTVSGVLTSDEGNTSLAGQPVTFTLGSWVVDPDLHRHDDLDGGRPRAPSRCPVSPRGRSPSPTPSGGTPTTSRPAPAPRSTSRKGTTLTVSPGTGTYNDTTTLTGTLIEHRHQPARAERTGDVEVERRTEPAPRRPTPAASPRALSRPPNHRGPIR